MKKGFLLAVCTLLLICLLLPASALTEPRVIWDRANLLDDAEEQSLLSQANEYFAHTGCEFAVVTYRERYSSDKYWGEDFISDSDRSFSDDLILLIITEKTNGVYNYDLYLYGDAERRITPEEVDEILDHRTVLPVIKSGQIYHGASAFLTVASEKYANEVTLPSPYLSALPVALILGAFVALMICLGIKKSYSTKKRSIDYPLDRFAKLELTEERDEFTGSFVTTRIISSGNGGGRGGSGGGSGGGRGHAGGR